ncbi:DUF2631 domain-containing protein [Amycolatopsis rhizosphaerae]|uniref:DUF2631 domain-containing protein n=1 Tax=Amycolatopsis rhizosphaerae TaxID=2053003 RepID=A0A558C6F7_9PSEU|nr:DUF2631 domain-containing protein [Amycolatopsis rhizosphaerae]TVT44287.1 DUF2631 domain-containing protein [Amycolatopsis rhizosphaerae]
MAGKTVEKRKHSGVGTVDPRDEPSAAWGWHGTFPKATRIAGWVTAILLFVMIYNNHENNTENVWLIGLGLAVIIGLLIDLKRQRTAWRR